MDSNLKFMIEELKKYNTSTISDALDKLGIIGQLHGIKPLKFGQRMAGPIFTVKYIPSGQVKKTTGEFLDDVPEGYVVMIDNEGRTDCTVWGDLMTKVALRNNVAGTIINGVCRDIDVILQLSYPMYSKDYYMRTGKDRVILQSVNQPVSVSNVQVNPGDIAIADDNGVVIVPSERLSDVLNITKDIEEAEVAIENEINNGNSLRKARELFKYHDLQKKMN